MVVARGNYFLKLISWVLSLIRQLTFQASTTWV